MSSAEVIRIEHHHPGQKKLATELQKFEEVLVRGSIPQSQPNSHRNPTHPPQLPVPLEKPLIIMNVDIGEKEPKKLEIFKDSDPEQHSRQFVQQNNLPEAMIPTIVTLISQNKSRVLEKRAKLEAEKQADKIQVGSREFQQYRNKSREINTPRRDTQNSTPNGHESTPRHATSESQPLRSSSQYALGSANNINRNSFEQTPQKVFKPYIPTPKSKAKNPIPEEVRVQNQPSSSKQGFREYTPISRSKSQGQYPLLTQFQRQSQEIQVQNQHKNLPPTPANFRNRNSQNSHLPIPFTEGANDGQNLGHPSIRQMPLKLATPAHPNLQNHNRVDAQPFILIRRNIMDEQGSIQAGNFFKEDEEELSQIRDSEILQKYGFSNQESDIFEQALGSNRAISNNQRQAYIPDDLPYQTFHNSEDEKQYGFQNYLKEATPVLREKEQEEKPNFGNSMSPFGAGNKYGPGNNKFKFRMSPKVNPSSSRRMVQKMTEKVGGRQSVDYGSREGSQNRNFKPYEKNSEQEVNQFAELPGYGQEFKVQARNNGTLDDRPRNNQYQASFENFNQPKQVKQLYMFDSYGSGNNLNSQGQGINDGYRNQEKEQKRNSQTSERRIVDPHQPRNDSRSKRSERILESSEVVDNYGYNSSRDFGRYQEPQNNPTSVSQVKVENMKSRSGIFFNPVNQDNVMLEKIFDQLDVNRKGRVRSYDVYLSNLKAEQKNLIHEILEDADQGSQFQSMDFEAFQRLINRSGRVAELRKKMGY